MAETMSRYDFEIDNITWNDLSLDDIYARLNSCETSAGEDYLFDSMKHPYVDECTEYREYISLSNELKDTSIAETFSKYLDSIGKLKAYKFKDVINEYKNSDRESNLRHFIIDILTVISFAMIFVFPGPGIVAFFIMIGYSVSDYFKKKNIIAGRLMVFSYLIKMLKAKLPAETYTESEILSKKISLMKAIRNDFKPFMRGTFLISEGARTSSNPLDILFDYVRMIFHVDIIKYNSMINFIKENTDKAICFYDTVGEIDCALSVNRFVLALESEDLIVCDSLTGSDYNSLNVENLYHPLLKHPVTNSINCDGNVLITGCNASGKSTFLKSITISALFAQSFGIAFAKNYSAPFYRIYSSMALKDDIDAGESYFISEIKSLKRIIDASEKEHILCVIDEVLRGTNTVERIASSVEILKSLNKQNVLCFAATHDIELTDLLKDTYTNYHFSEEITGEDIIFSYKLKDGAATSRNAIRLLSLLGYDDSLVERATKRADDFVKTSKWH